MKYARVIEREDGKPIKWRCNGFTIEKYKLEGLIGVDYVYGVGVKDACFTYRKTLDEARKFCSENSVAASEGRP